MKIARAISFGMILVIVLALLIASFLSFFLVVLTPRWSFTITTDKTIYTASDDIRFTVTLKNAGYIPQTITSGITRELSGITEPLFVVIDVEEDHNGLTGYYVWYSGDPKNASSSLTLPAGNSITRTYEFNQSLIEQGYRSGPYIIWIYAVIPKPGDNDMNDFLWQKDLQLSYAQKVIEIPPGQLPS
jgi:hypothetical protein